jgi:hypothetical protein
MLQAIRRGTAMSTREEKVKQRIKAGHAKIVKRLQDAQAADKVRGLFADYGVKIDGPARRVC